MLHIASATSTMSLPVVKGMAVHEANSKSGLIYISFVSQILKQVYLIIADLYKRSGKNVTQTIV